MPGPTLPNETLLDIFSRLPPTSSLSTFYHLSCSCRQFFKLLKPHMYTNITITSHEQYEKMLNVNKEDARLVRKLSVKGTGGRLVSAGSTLRNPGTECIKDLLTGELLDLSVIEVLTVSDLYTDSSALSETFAVEDLKVAEKLVELSVRNHQGGGTLWQPYLENHDKLLPMIRRLGIDQVTSFVKPEGPILTAVGVPQGAYDNTPFDKIMSLEYNHTSLYDRLEVVAVTETLELVRPSREQDLKELKLLRLSGEGPRGVLGWFSLSASESMNCRYTPGLPMPNFRPTLQNCQNMFTIIHGNRPRRPTYLLLHFPRYAFSTECQNLMDSLKMFEVEIHYSDEEEEEEESNSLIPKSFVEFVERQKKKKEEEETARRLREQGAEQSV